MTGSRRDPRASEVHEPVATILGEGSFQGKSHQANCSWGVVQWSSEKVIASFDEYLSAQRY